MQVDARERRLRRRSAGQRKASPCSEVRSPPLDGTRGWRLVTAAALAAVCACVSTKAPPARSEAPVDAAALRRVPARIPEFAIGYNEAWFGHKYGFDLTLDFDRDRIARTFDAMSRAGARVVRLWVFEGRQGIRLGEGVPQTQGIEEDLLSHLAYVLEVARSHGMLVELTALEGNEMPAESNAKRDYFVRLLTDRDGEGEAFRTRALKPLLALLDDNRDVLYGFDLINEIEAPRDRGYFVDRVAGPRAFMRELTAFVKRETPWLRVTSSAGWDSGAADIASGLFSGLGLDFYSLHAYSDEGVIPGVEAVCRRARADGVAIVLGEYGQKSKREDDALQSYVTERFLHHARATCFSGALAWRFDAAESWWHYQSADGHLRPAAAIIAREATRATPSNAASKAAFGPSPSPTSPSSSPNDRR